LTIFEIAGEISKVPGNVVELGSWQIANLIGIAKMLRHLGFDTTRSLYIFDSFEGLTKPPIEDKFHENLREYTVEISLN
jgi:hypothetical protein